MQILHSNSDKVKRAALQFYLCLTHFFMFNFRHEIGNINADVGTHNEKIWDRLLKGKSEKVFNLLVLMAEKIKCGQPLGEQTQFWKYVIQNDKANGYRIGTRNDTKNNSLFHYCA